MNPFDTLLRALLKLDMRAFTYLLALIVGLLSWRAVVVYAEIARVTVELTGVRELTEAHLILECLDPTKIDRLRTARIPCTTLFDKYGIRP